MPTVLIAGAGPTGLVMAHELARHGIRCRLIDKAPDRPVTSRAIAVLPRTMEVFELIGVAVEIDADHFLHGYFSSLARVRFNSFQ